jgi:hypothetical protein
MGEESKDELPVACTLSSAEMRERRRQVLAPLWAAVAEVKSLEGGMALRFAPERASLAGLAELIELERRCCPFLRFELAVEPGGGPVWLSLTGPPGTRGFLAAELGLPAAAEGAGGGPL